MDQLIEALNEFLERSGRILKRRAVTPIERTLEKAMQRAFRAQGRAFVKRFASLRGRFSESLLEDDWLYLFNEATLETWGLFEGPLTEAVKDALQAGAAQALKDWGVELGITFDLANPRAVEYIRLHGADLITKINETTQAYIRNVIRVGVDEGWSYNQMAKAITQRYEEFAIGKPQLHIESRAHLVAVTEAGNAYEAGNFMPAQELADHGIAMEKQWSTMKDDLVSKGCQMNELDGWIPISQLHSSGDMHPLRFPGCRCDELYRRKVV